MEEKKKGDFFQWWREKEETALNGYARLQKIFLAN